GATPRPATRRESSRSAPLRAVSSGGRPSACATPPTGRAADAAPDRLATRRRVRARRETRRYPFFAILRNYAIDIHWERNICLQCSNSKSVLAGGMRDNQD